MNMTSLSQSRLASTLLALVGVWLLISPLAVSITGAALANILAVGGILAVAGSVQLLWKNSIPSWVGAVVAVWLFVAAFAFSAGTLAAWNQAIVAIVAFLLSTWDSLEVTNIQREHHARS